MTLYELENSMTIQSNVEVRQMLDNGDVKKSVYFEYCEDLASADLDGLEDMEVTYIYSETFEQKYWNYTKTRPLLVIEVKGEE